MGLCLTILPLKTQSLKKTQPYKSVAFCMGVHNTIATDITRSREENLWFSLQI